MQFCLTASLCEIQIPGARSLRCRKEQNKTGFNHISQACVPSFRALLVPPSLLTSDLGDPSSCCRWCTGAGAAALDVRHDAFNYLTILHKFAYTQAGIKRPTASG